MEEMRLIRNYSWGAIIKCWGKKASILFAIFNQFARLEARERAEIRASFWGTKSVYIIKRPFTQFARYWGHICAPSGGGFPLIYRLHLPRRQLICIKFRARLEKNEIVLRNNALTSSVRQYNLRTNRLNHS